jgi:DNA-binding transcriptional LysR family regulator
MDLYRVNLNLLIALDALLLEQSVTFAAKKLFITQAAMSNSLQQLRILFKDDLLVRDKSRMILTHYARELQPRLHQVVQEVHSLVVSGQRFEAKTSERVFKIGTSDYMAALLLPKLIACLQHQAPKMKIMTISVNVLV